MHDEELTVLICGGMKRSLRRRRDGALSETGDHFPCLFDAKCNQSVTQVAKRFAAVYIRKFKSLKNRSRVNSRIHEVNGDADGNTVQQRPLRTAHSADFGQ